MQKTILIAMAAFVAGALLTAAPFAINSHLMHLDETSRGEPTMGPGITLFMGMVAAPLGGLAAAIIAVVIYRRYRRRNSPT